MTTTETLSIERRAATSREGVLCDHCSLPVPPGAVRPTDAEQFCCEGCRTVYHVLRENGLERFYEIRDRDPVREPARSSGRGYEEFDDPKFHELHVRKAGESSLASVELYLEGVHCAACVWLVEKLPAVVPGVVEARLDVRRALVRLVWDGSRVALSRIARALDSLGYSAHPAKDADTRRLRAAEDRRFLVRLGVAGAAAGNVMALSFALYGGAFTGIEDRYASVFRLVSAGFAWIAILGPGRLFFRGAWAALRTRTPHLDLPIALGIGVGAGAGTFNAIHGHGEIYFDSITVLIFLLLVGRFIQHRQQRFAGDALELLFSLTPTRASRLDGDVVTTVPIAALRPGDRVEVTAGDTIPVDGRIEAGSSDLDRALLTGESRPERVRTGDTVRAGAVNLTARLVVTVEAVGEETRVGRLMRAVEENVRRKAPIVRMADRISGYFVLGVVSLSLITLALWWRVAPEAAIAHATSLLIVTCPCALGLATPLVIAVAIGRAAKRGLFVKGGDALERMANAHTILLDKTGTLTEGRVALVQWIGDESVKPAVAALERESSHPLACGIVASLAEEGVAPARVEPGSVEQITGAGISGDVDGSRILVGSPAFVLQQPFENDHATVWVDVLTDTALTPVLIAVDGEVVAAAGLGDPVRPDAESALRSLREAGYRVGVVSGDHPRVVASVARQLGVSDEDIRGGVSPERKISIVEEYGGADGVVMVGDGVNDAAALAAASVGIAVHGGAEASIAAADVYASRPGLASVVELARGGRRALQVIRRGLGVSLAYNVVAAALAVGGLLHPWIAAILMPVSSVSVLALAWAARTFEVR